MRTRVTVTSVVLGVVAAVLATLAIADASRSGGAASPRTKLTIIAPADPGGGWDGFAREAQQALRENGVVNQVQVMNIPGAGGTIGLGQFVKMEGRHDVLLVTGAVMVGGIIMSDSDATIQDTTPIAQLANDYNAIVVPADSPYETLDDLIAAWQENPRGTGIAGGSLGGIDHLLAGLLADEVGIDPADVNYIAYAGGAEAVNALRSNSADVGISGYDDFSDQIEAGELRPLAISSADRLPGIDIPTLIEQGYDVEVANWRGLLAPPGIDDATRAELIAIVEEMRDTPEWEDAVDRNNWLDEFAGGDDFDAFLDEETARIERIMEELGL